MNTMKLFFTPQELADKWKVSPRTLANRRYLGGGPRYTKLGGKVAYPVKAVEEYEALTRTHTERLDADIEAILKNNAKGCRAAFLKGFTSALEGAA